MFARFPLLGSLKTEDEVLPRVSLAKATKIAAGFESQYA